MKTFIQFMFCHASDKSNMLLLLGVLLFMMSSCETEYIPPDPEDNTSAVATEGNFTLNIGFANFGEQDSIQNLGADADSLSTTHRMEADTSVFKVNDDLSIYTTLTEDPVGSAPAVKTKSFTAGAKIRVLAYAVTGSPTPTYTKAFDEEYSFSSSKLSRSSGTGNIMLPQGTYKFIAYSYNNTTVTPVSPLLNIDTIIPDIDPVNDLIWGESVPTTVYDGPPLDTVKINMVHKLSQIKLVAATPQDATPSITAFSNVTMPGYYFDLETFNGVITQKGPVQQNFDFPALPANPADTVKATPRTVYTGTPGDIPTIISIGSMTVDNKTITDFKATFAKSLKSGYSYTMTMRIGNAINLPSDATHPDNTPAGMFTYVGAFWKHDQTGERLIRVPRLANGLMDSVWTAQVIEGRDWILLDKVMTTDPNVGWRSGASEASVQNGNDPLFETDPNRQLSAPTASTFVSGMVLPSGSDNQIYFRIGLKNHYQPSIIAPARYGLVLLTYGNNKYRQRIWIRQGEDPDYLMRPGDLNGNGGTVTGNRSRAAKFSPYNLTDPNKNTATTYGGAPNLGAKGGDMVDYPSKAGYHFQWNGNTKAFHPTNTITGWTTRAGNTWNDNVETCPTGYRRPTDAFATAGNSEIRNSLWITGAANNDENQPTDLTNVVYGYYADGYFDRREIVQAIAGPTSNYSALPRAVATPGAEVAYVGMLFYNRNNNASLFFPATGFRISSATATNGRLDQAGESGHNWSRSWPATAAYPMQLAFDLTAQVSHMNSLDPDLGLAIRCVVDTTSAFPPIPSYDDPANGFIPFVGAFWKANQTGERLIRMTTTAADVGTWTAYVLVGQDWIDVDATMTSDANVGWRPGANESAVDDANSTGFDARHPVALTNSISGITTTANPTIYFRIGLSSVNSGSAPRYGMVLLQYANKTKYQRIWIRQGEMDDYAPGQTSGTKWSPYNLANANNFVSYPSQAGYFYQWISPTPYDPVNPVGDITSGWNSNDSDPFNLLSITPSNNYTIPSQEDVLGLTSVNSVFGYYADGFFDRRQITPSITYGNEPGGSDLPSPFDMTAVSAQTSNVGYIGVLIFNPPHDESLFLPAAGYRYGLPASGTLGWTGRLGNYWTTSRSPVLNSTEEYFFDIGDPNIFSVHNFLSLNRTYGCSVRCVVATLY